MQRTRSQLIVAPGAIVETMRSAWVGLVCCVLVVGGCFSEPPPASNDGSTSDAATDATGMLETTSGSSSSGGLSTSSGSTTPDSGDTTDADTGTSTGPSCELFPADLGSVGADIVIVIDDGIDADELGWLWPFIGMQWTAVSVAVVAPNTLDHPVIADPGCPNGCGECRTAGRVVVRTEPGAGLSQAITNSEAYECIFRDPPAIGQETTRHVWMITRAPEQALSPAAVQALVDLDIQVHATCPDCTEGGGSALEELVDGADGSLADLDDPNAAQMQAGPIGARRPGCAWSPTLPNDDASYHALFQTNLFGLDEDDFFELVPVAGFGSCSDWVAEEPPLEYFVVQDPPTHVLCLPACFVARQGTPDDVQVTEAHCPL